MGKAKFARQARRVNNSWFFLRRAGIVFLWGGRGEKIVCIRTSKRMGEYLVVDWVGRKESWKLEIMWCFVAVSGGMSCIFVGAPSDEEYFSR